MTGGSTDVVDDAQDDDDGEIPGQARRHRNIDGYAVELVDKVAAVLGCRVEYYVVDGETRQQQQQQQGGGSGAGRSRSPTPNMNRPGTHHQHHQTRVLSDAADYGTWTRLVEELTSQVIDIYSTTGNRSRCYVI